MTIINGNNIDNWYDLSSSPATTNGRDIVRSYGGHDTVFGEGGNDDLYGGAGDDELDGGDGTDKLYGEAGHDTLHDGGDGADQLYGGQGNDRYVFVDTGDRVIELAGQGYDTIEIHFPAFSTYTMPNHVERLVVWNDGFTAIGNAQANLLESYGWANRLDGGGGADTVRGDDGGNTLDGGAGDERLEGFYGVDLLRGGDGADTLLGGGGLDRMYGGSGRDKLNSGTGADLLDGGADADTYVYTGYTASAPGDQDRILSFEFNADRIDLSGIDANSSVDGDQAFVWNELTPGGAGTLWARDSSTVASDAIVYGNMDADATPEFQLTVDVGTHGAIWFADFDFVL